MHTKTGIALLAITVLLFMQTGLCPKCVFIGCNEHSSAQAAGRDALPVSGCCQAESQATAPAHTTSSACEGCEETCDNSCYSLEKDALLPIHTAMADVSTAIDALVQSALEITTGQAVHQRSDLNPNIPQDLPPPDSVRGVCTTELLL
jgi:hypothetical protein